MLFYTIFYIILAALFAICMVGLNASIDRNRPSYTTTRSIIGTNPGLGFRPISNDTVEGALIWYNAKNETQVQKWVTFVKKFLTEYEIQKPGPQSKIAPECGFDHLPTDGKACPVNLTSFGECGPPYYGYNTSSPCVFLKLNKIFDWIPEYYNNTNDTDIKKMPTELIDEIKVYEMKNQSNQVWVSCYGEYAADKERFSGFMYLPNRGFPSYYYPYRHKKDEYLSPLIAVRILQPKPGVLVNIECRAWAKNIEYATGAPEKRKGSVRFEILRDDHE